uniref:Uncharacterized protein n=1 Tax=Hucho hucho TaxID=62062 RepID=A0A4W5KVJ0_9TELE
YLVWVILVDTKLFFHPENYHLDCPPKIFLYRKKPLRMGGWKTEVRGPASSTFSLAVQHHRGCSGARTILLHVLI